MDGLTRLEVGLVGDEGMNTLVMGVATRVAGARSGAGSRAMDAPLRDELDRSLACSYCSIAISSCA
jgi:hypothetical protein